KETLSHGRRRMIKAISHLGVAVNDLEEARNYYRSIFGLESSEPMIGGGGTVKASLVELDNAVVELLAPIGSEGAIAKFLEKRGEGIQHVCYEVDDINAEIESLKAKGIEPLGKPMPGAEGLSVFLHPKGTHGVLVELVEKK
ncbi:MAG: methylmalonyl-CoA epimerase, partial [Dehalococcoidia bacterium]|nr:methylmalonyl-CoA epimerase [Dehalococcoidia bacterium]